MDIIHKAVGIGINEIDEDDRSFWAVASTGDPDRDGDVVNPKGWKLDNFKKNPVIPWMHDYWSPPVARAEDIKVENGQLMVKLKFAEPETYYFADVIYRLYKGEFLNSFSVGFDPIESKDRAGGGREITQQELYEVSCVTLPSNPHARAQIKSAVEAGAISQEEADKLASRMAPEPKDGTAAELAQVKAKLADAEKKLKEADKKPKPGQDGELADQVKALAADLAELKEAKNSPPEIDQKILTSALEEALPNAVAGHVEAAVEKSLKYHRGQVD